MRSFHLMKTDLSLNIVCLKGEGLEGSGMVGGSGVESCLGCLDPCGFFSRYFKWRDEESC